MPARQASGYCILVPPRPQAHCKHEKYNGRGCQPFFEQVSRELKAWIREGSAPPLAFVVDELRFVDTKAEAFDWLTRCATREQIMIVGTAHRPSDVTVDLRAIVDVWCLFAMTQEHDLRVIEERCSIATAQLVRRLRPREFVVWDDTNGTRHLYRDPAAWHVPLQVATPTAAETVTAAFPDASVDKGKLFQ
jgi:hypothetical protein